MRCSSCNTKFKGDYCPNCGTLVLMNRRRGHGFFHFLWRLVGTAVTLAVLALVAFAVLDCTGLGKNPGDPALYRYTEFVRGLLPADVLAGYEWLKLAVADTWRGLMQQSGGI